jgi:hypothetical protein
VRIVVQEIRNFPRRIRAILRTSDLRFGPSVPLSLWDHSWAGFSRENKFLDACSSDMEQIMNQHSWCGYLDAEIAGLSFQHGARWALRNHDSEKDSGHS